MEQISSSAINTEVTLNSMRDLWDVERNGKIAGKIQNYGKMHANNVCDEEEIEGRTLGNMIRKEERIMGKYALLISYIKKQKNIVQECKKC